MHNRMLCFFVFGAFLLLRFVGSERLDATATEIVATADRVDDAHEHAAVAGVVLLAL